MKRFHGGFVVFAARCLPGSMLEQLLMHAYAALLAPHSAHVVFRCALPAYPFSVTRNHTHVRMPLVHARAGGTQHGPRECRLENQLLICCPAHIMQHESREARLGDKGLLFLLSGYHRHDIQTAHKYDFPPTVVRSHAEPESTTTVGGEEKSPLSILGFHFSQIPTLFKYHLQEIKGSRLICCSLPIFSSVCMSSHSKPCQTRPRSTGAGCLPISALHSPERTYSCHCIA